MIYGEPNLRTHPRHWTLRDWGGVPWLVMCIRRARAEEQHGCQSHGRRIARTASTLLFGSGGWPHQRLDSCRSSSRSSHAPPLVAAAFRRKKVPWRRTGANVPPEAPYWDIGALSPQKNCASVRVSQVPSCPRRAGARTWSEPEELEDGYGSADCQQRRTGAGPLSGRRGPPRRRRASWRGCRGRSRSTSCECNRCRAPVGPPDRRRFERTPARGQ